MKLDLQEHDCSNEIESKYVLCFTVNHGTVFYYTQAAHGPEFSASQEQLFLTILIGHFCTENGQQISIWIL